MKTGIEICYPSRRSEKRCSCLASRLMIREMNCTKARGNDGNGREKITHDTHCSKSVLIELLLLLSLSS